MRDEHDNEHEIVGLREIAGAAMAYAGEVRACGHGDIYAMKAWEALLDKLEKHGWLDYPDDDVHTPDPDYDPNVAAREQFYGEA